MAGGFDTAPSNRRKQRHRMHLARRAETLVAEHLEAQGFTVLGRNVRLGRDELDIVARKGPLLVICEVRSRSNARWVDPSHTLTLNKRRALRRAAAQLLHRLKLGPVQLRLDLAAVVFDGTEPRLNYLPGSW